MQEVPGWTDQKASIPWAKMTAFITDITIPASAALTAYAASSVNKHTNMLTRKSSWKRVLQCQKSNSTGHITTWQSTHAMQEVCGWINQRASTPVWAKRTPNTTDITTPARTALTAGCEGVAAIKTIQSVMEVNLKTP